MPSVSVTPTLSLRPNWQPRLTNGRSQSPNELVVRFDGWEVRWDPIYLRDICPCDKCVHPSTRQKLFCTTDLPENIFPKEFNINKKGNLEVIWNTPDEHKSVYDAAYLWRFTSDEGRRFYRFPVPQQVYWDGDIMERSILRTDYNAFLEDDQMLHRVLMQLHLYGLAFFVNIPSENTDGTEISKLARRIGEIKQTFYGTTWDVKAVRESKNIAYLSH
jgi:gamma-butyrobetaine dioxygenase